MGVTRLDSWPILTPLTPTPGPVWQRWLSALVVAVNGTIAGTGSPETVVTAAPGTLYRRLDGAAGTGLYVKETAADLNTGWRAV